MADRFERSAFFALAGVAGAAAVLGAIPQRAFIEMATTEWLIRKNEKTLPECLYSRCRGLSAKFAYDPAICALVVP